MAYDAHALVAGSISKSKLASAVTAPVVNHEHFVARPFAVEEVDDVDKGGGQPALFVVGGHNDADVDGRR